MQCVMGKLNCNKYKHLTGSKFGNSKINKIRRLAKDAFHKLRKGLRSSEILRETKKSVMNCSLISSLYNRVEEDS